MAKRGLIRFLIVAVLLGPFTVGCTPARIGASWQQDLLHSTPDGPNKFKLGWRDGCYTGIAATANHHGKFFYEFTQNYQLAQDNEYYTGWRIAWLVCQRYVFNFYARAPF